MGSRVWRTFEVLSKKANSAKRPFPVSIWLLTAATEKVKWDIS